MKSLHPNTKIGAKSSFLFALVGFWVSTTNTNFIAGAAGLNRVSLRGSNTRSLQATTDAPTSAATTASSTFGPTSTYFPTTATTTSDADAPTPAPTFSAYP